MISEDKETNDNYTHTHLLVSLPGFRRQQLVGDGSVDLCV